MDIRKISNKKLAKEVYGVAKGKFHPDWKTLDKHTQNQTLIIAKFLRQCVKDSTPKEINAAALERYFKQMDFRSDIHPQDYKRQAEDFCHNFCLPDF